MEPKKVLEVGSQVLLALNPVLLFICVYINIYMNLYIT